MRRTEDEPESMETGKDDTEDPDVLIIDNDETIDDIVTLANKVKTGAKKVMTYYDKKGKEIGPKEHFANAIHKGGDISK